VVHTFYGGVARSRSGSSSFTASALNKPSSSYSSSSSSSSSSRPSSLPSAVCTSHCCCLGESKRARLELSRRRDCWCGRRLAGFARDDACRDARRLVIKCTCAADVTETRRHCTDMRAVRVRLIHRLLTRLIHLPFECEAEDLSRCCGGSCNQNL